MKALAGKSIVVFDLETKEPCGTPEVSWKDYGKMGISVGCAFDYRTMEYKVFMDDNIQEMRELLAGAKLVTGFNIIGFDLPLIAAHTTPVEKHPELEIYDLLYESRKTVGGGFPKGLRLDDHLEGTFGKENMKTADGAGAPLMWKNKELGKLVSYCLADVKREKMLFEHVLLGKPVNTKTHGEKTLALPKFFSGVVQE